MDSPPKADAPPAQNPQPFIFFSLCLRAFVAMYLQARRDSNPQPSVLETDALTNWSYWPISPELGAYSLE